MPPPRPRGRNLFAQAAPVKDERGTLTRAISNTPESARRFVGGIVDVVKHPIQTLETLGEVGTGAVQNALPKRLQAASAQGAREKAGAVGGYFKERYGGLENIRETFATDPVGFAADAATLFTGGGALAAKAGTTLNAASKGAAATKAANIANKTGTVLSSVGRAVDPITAIGKVGAPVANFAGRRVADVVGGLGTHTGGESVRQAFVTGKEGGEAASAFRENMRGNVPPSEVVGQARQAVATLREQRGAAYRAGMANVAKDQGVLDMQPVIDELNKQSAKGQFKGQTLDPSAAEVKQQVTEAVVEWWRQNPAEFHTPEGLDALKQKIGDIRETTEYGSRARTVVDSVYHSVKDTITKQAPEYAKVMKDYESASEALREVEKALSLGDKGRITADTALRKLQSILRNNANTNYGARVQSAKKLEDAGASTLRPALAGQALNTWTPRGFGGMVAGGTGVAGAMTMNPSFIPLLAAQSPRLVGEFSHAAGRATNALGRSAGAARPAGLTAYEADQLKRGVAFPRNALAR